MQRFCFSAAFVAWGALWLLGGGVTVSAAKPKAADVVARVLDYVRDYIPALVNVVADETYQQKRGSGSPSSRHLLSDFLLVGVPGRRNVFMPFRDVREVDGVPVADQQERILSLFVNPTDDAVHRATRIAQESQRYHLPGGSFAMTNPLAVITLMQDTFYDRVRFRLSGDEAPEWGAGAVVLAFEEPRSQFDLDSGFFGPGARGRLWVDATTGRVFKTEVAIGPRANAASATTFAADARLGLLVPQEMRTTWPDGASSREVKGVATYSRYRRFDVQTDVDIQLPPAP